MDTVIEFFEANRIARLLIGLAGLVGAVAIATASNLALGWAGLWVIVGLGVALGLAIGGRLVGAAGGDSAWGAVLAGVAAAAFAVWVWNVIPRPEGWVAWAGPGLAVCVVLNGICLWFGQSQGEEADEETSWP